jgi:hypothetical protein
MASCAPIENSLLDPMFTSGAASAFAGRVGGPP